MLRVVQCFFARVFGPESGYGHLALIEIDKAITKDGLR